MLFKNVQIRVEVNVKKRDLDESRYKPIFIYI